MSLGGLRRAGIFLARIARTPVADRTPRGVRESLDQTFGGVPYDLYRPAGRPRGAVVAVHGVVLTHRRDHRLVHFGRTLARLGVLCVTPTLAELSAGRFVAGEPDVLATFIGDTLAHFGLPTGVVGFSFGAGYGLVAASHPSLREALRFVVGFGAYHALGDVLDELVARDRTAPATDTAWDDRIYLRALLAHTHPGQAGLGPEGLRELEALLAGYCDGVSLEAKRAFHDRHLAHLDLLAPARAALSPETLQALSPAGRLGRLGCPVSLLHDPDDSLISPEQALRLRAELMKAPSAGRHRVLVTPLLSHVTPGGLVALGDLPRLCAALAPIFETP